MAAHPRKILIHLFPPLFEHSKLRANFVPPRTLQIAFIFEALNELLPLFLFTSLPLLFPPFFTGVLRLRQYSARRVKIPLFPCPGSVLFV